MITMTVEHALRIQAEHLAHYSALYPHRAHELAAALALATSAHELEPGKQYPVYVVNRHIPRGGWFETSIPEIREREDALRAKAALANAGAAAEPAL